MSSTFETNTSPNIQTGQHTHFGDSFVKGKFFQHRLNSESPAHFFEPPVERWQGEVSSASTYPATDERNCEENGGLCERKVCDETHRQDSKPQVDLATRDAAMQHLATEFDSFEQRLAGIEVQFAKSSGGRAIVTEAMYSPSVQPHLDSRAPVPFLPHQVSPHRGVTQPEEIHEKQVGKTPRAPDPVSTFLAAADISVVRSAESGISSANRAKATVNEIAPSLPLRKASTSVTGLETIDSKMLRQSDTKVALKSSTSSSSPPPLEPREASKSVFETETKVLHPLPFSSHHLQDRKQARKEDACIEIAPASKHALSVQPADKMLQNNCNTAEKSVVVELVPPVIDTRSVLGGATEDVAQLCKKGAKIEAGTEQDSVNASDSVFTGYVEDEGTENPKGGVGIAVQEQGGKMIVTGMKKGSR